MQRPTRASHNICWYTCSGAADACLQSSVSCSSRYTPTSADHVQACTCDRPMRRHDLSCAYLSLSLRMSMRATQVLRGTCGALASCCQGSVAAKDAAAARRCTSARKRFRATNRCRLVSPGHPTSSARPACTQQLPFCEWIHILISHRGPSPCHLPLQCGQASASAPRSSAGPGIRTLVSQRRHDATLGGRSSHVRSSSPTCQQLDFCPDLITSLQRVHRGM